MSKLLKEPLLHFLLAGAVLLYVYNALNPDSDKASAIRVDLPAMLTFVQYRSKSFEPTLAQERWDALPRERRQQLVDDYLREEILFREAQKLDLQRDDYIIKRRLIQKMEFLLKPAPESISIDEQALQAYYADNTELYQSHAHATFTHVFFSKDNQGIAKLPALRDTLNKDNKGFSDAINYGDRFLYHQNYVERTQDYIASQMGDIIAIQVFASDSQQQQWLGPFTSAHGEHLLFINSVQRASTPELASIRGRVEHDFRREQQSQQFDDAYAALLKQYAIKISESVH